MSTLFPGLKGLLRVTLLCLFLLAPLAAQTPSPSATPTERSLTQLQQRLSEVQQRLEDAPDTPGGVSSLGEVPPFTDSLRRLDVSLRRLITLEESKSRAQSQLQTLDEELERVTTTGLDEPKPHSVDLLDDLQAELDLTEEKASGSELANTAARTTRDLENSELESLQTLRRRLLDSQAGKPQDITLRRRIENLEVAIEASQTAVELAQAEIDVLKLELEASQKRFELLTTKVKLVQQNFKFSKDILDEQLERLESARKEHTEVLEEFKTVRETSRGRLDALLADTIDDATQVEEIEARREWVLTHQRKERLLEERLEFNLARRDLWERRFLASAGQSSAKYEEWVASARGIIVRVEKNRDVLNTELSQIRTELSELIDASDSEEPDTLDSPQARWKEVQTEALVARQKAIEDALRYEEETEHLASRLLSELNFHQDEASFGERVSQAWSALIGIWNIELYTLGDSAVTVGKVCVALLVLIIGLGVTGRFTHFLAVKLFTKLPIRENVKSNLERFIRYFFVLIVFLFALHVVNIPLTIFTFLGGTLAIAVGFGAQNILKNFISGLILMVERPVRVGDLVEVDSTLGFIEEIGARSTRIRVPAGIHVILPNSKLLENKVINWTLQDHRLRIKVSVGVAYGSPTRKVIDLIKQAVVQQESVHKSPAPTVTFEEFGDSSLNFTVHFWVTVVSPLDRDIISTEVRLLIDDLFREHNISIPFPQRDVNFNSPVPVRIVDETSQ